MREAAAAARANVCSSSVEIRPVERLGGWRGALKDGESFDVVVVQDSLMGMDLPLDVFALLADASGRRATYAPRRRGRASGCGTRGAQETRVVVKSRVGKG